MEKTRPQPRLSLADKKVRPQVPFDLYAFPFENVVFEGGSGNLLAFVGAVQFLEEAAIWSRVVRLAGSGTGAFVATLLALGYTSQQLEQLINFDIRKLARDSVCSPCCLMSTKYGWHPNQKVITWLKARLKEKTGKYDCTFLEMYRKVGKELCVVVTNVSSGYVEYCHVKTTPYLPVIDAVRMTLATPGLCRPVKIRRQDRDQYFADGGIYFNYPVHCFDGWWLSLSRQDDFLHRQGYVSEQSRLVDDPTRFAKFNAKTLGFVLFDELAHDSFTKQLDERCSQYKAVVPDSSSARQWNTQLQKCETSLEAYTSYTKTALKLADFLIAKVPDMEAALTSQQIDDIIGKFEITDAELMLLFGGHQDIFTEVQDRMSLGSTEVNGNAIIRYLKLVSFSHFRRCQLTRNIKTRITSLDDFFETVQRIIRLSNCRPSTSKDVERTVGINCRYLGALQTSELSKQDRLFLIEQGRLSTKCYLEQFVSTARPPIKDTPSRRSYCRDDLAQFIDDDISEIIDERDYAENASVQQRQQPVHPSPPPQHHHQQ